MPTPIARRLNGERLVLLAWSRAILLQLAHPLVAAGVADHSSFREGPVTAARRLHHTVQAMLALTFGDDAAREAALSGIRRIHTRVHGTLREAVGPFAAGTPYSAEDPPLVAWVHLTLLDSVPRAYDALVEPLSLADRDGYCAESASVALALGARPADVPRTWHEVEQAFGAMLASGTLAVGPDARALADAVLTPPLALVTGPLASLNRLITAAWLPDDLRRQYGLPWSAARERRFVRAVSALRGTRRVLPALFSHWRVATTSRG